MEIKFKLIWKLLMIAIAVNAPFSVIENIQSGASGIKDLIVIILYPLLFYGGVFLGPTLRIIFSDSGINVTWKVGIGPLKIWEQRNYRLRWEEVTAVYSVFPPRFPIHIIGVAGYQHDVEKDRNFFIGFATTKKKESLLYIAEHVPRQVITDEVWVLVEKYRRQRGAKQAGAT